MVNVNNSCMVAAAIKIIACNNEQFILETASETRVDNQTREPTALTSFYYQIQLPGAMPSAKVTIFKAEPFTVVIGASFVPIHKEEVVPREKDSKDCNIKKQQSYKDATITASV